MFFYHDRPKNFPLLAQAFPLKNNKTKNNENKKVTNQKSFNLFSSKEFFEKFHLLPIKVVWDG